MKTSMKASPVSITGLIGIYLFSSLFFPNKNEAINTDILKGLSRKVGWVIGENRFTVQTQALQLSTTTVHWRALAVSTSSVRVSPT